MPEFVEESAADIIHIFARKRLAVEDDVIGQVSQWQTPRRLEALRCRATDDYDLSLCVKRIRHGHDESQIFSGDCVLSDDQTRHVELDRQLVVDLRDETIRARIAEED